MTDPSTSPNASELTDIGDFLAVPEDQRLDVDDVLSEEISEDQLVTDFAHVPDGDVVDLEALASEQVTEQAADERNEQ